MNAVARPIRDIGPERQITLTLSMGNWALDVTVRYIVSYQSIWHRGRGIDPDITILSSSYDEGLVDNKPFALLPGMHDAILDLIEADELGD